MHKPEYNIKLLQYEYNCMTLLWRLPLSKVLTLNYNKAAKYGFNIPFKIPVPFQNFIFYQASNVNTISDRLPRNMHIQSLW